MIGFLIGEAIGLVVIGLFAFTIAWTMARGEPWWRRRREAFLAELDRDLS